MRIFGKEGRRMDSLRPELRQGRRGVAERDNLIDAGCKIGEKGIGSAASDKIAISMVPVGKM